MSPLRPEQIEADQQGRNSGLTERLLSNVSDSPTYTEPETSDSLTSRLSHNHLTPEEDASLWSKLTYSYASGLIKLGYAQPLHQQHLWDVAPKRHAAVVTRKFHAALLGTKDPVKAPHGKVFRALWTTHWRRLAAAAGFCILQNLCSWSGPFLLQQLLSHLQANAMIWWCLLISVAMFTVSSIQSVVDNYFLFLGYEISLHVKVDLMDMLYQKSLRVSVDVRNTRGIGAMLNLQSNDASNVWQMPVNVHTLWSSPLQIVVLMALLSQMLTWQSALAGLGVTLAILPLSLLVTRWQSTTRQNGLEHTDARVKLTGEVLTGIKAIKLYAWEQSFKQRILSLRHLELTQLRRAAYLEIIDTLIFGTAPILIALSAFAVYTKQGYALTPAVAFPALALFNLLRFPITMLPWFLMEVVDSWVALGRMQQFMQEDELQPHLHMSAAQTDQPAVQLHCASFAWGQELPPAIQNISVTALKGKLVMVVGAVGSGKSSLLAAILGELHGRGGHVEVHGTMSYTAQEPWIQNCSLQDNILMQLPLDGEQYHQVLQACALLPDLELLPAGDQTEIGEKGVNLSGGQRHRVALARACCAQSDIALLDDPLSAVDAHVGAHIFQTCICGLLADKTRILATHQMQYLPAADWVVVMEGGHITHQGRYDDLMAQGVELHQVSTPGSKSFSTAPSANNDAIQATEDDVRHINEPLTDASDSPSSFGGSSDEEEEKCARTDANGRLIQVEGRSIGKIDKETYKIYLRAWGALYILPILMLLLAIMERSVYGLQNWWLSVWSNANAAALAPDSDAHTQPASYYLKVYLGLALFIMAANVLRDIVAVWGSYRASKHMHERLLSHVLMLPLAFFDSQPLGRLLNRFTKDTEAVDEELFNLVLEVVDCLASALGDSALVLIVTPSILILAVPLVFGYLRVQNLYVATSRELKRLDSIALSPIFSNFSETLSGLMSVRAFQKQKCFVERNMTLIDQSNKAWWPMQIMNRWLAIRIEFISNLVVFGTAILVSVVLPVNAGLAGLALTAAANLTDNLSWFVRMATDLEVNMNAVERMIEYTSQPLEGSSQTITRPPPQNWPHAGGIVIENLQVRYREDLDLVLKDISLSISPREKIGIVGRTGCGKSTLVSTLFRLVEPTAGRVVIDGHDLAQVPLHQLRSKLAFVPQEPVIFSGTVRDNLDPFNASQGDAALWAALRQTGMAATVQALQEGLDAVLDEAGSNLSTGQRQLLCMARALLRKAKVLVLDEATSNVDSVSDALIQETVKAAFADCTVLTVAHRLHSVVDSDRILVLEDGRVKEFDTPESLLQNPKGIYYGMMSQATTTKTTASIVLSNNR